MMSHLLSKSSGFISSSKSVYKKLLSIRYFATAKKVNVSTTVDMDELKKFDSKADEWWHGKHFKPLHMFNSLRVPLIRDGILSVSRHYTKVSHPLEGYKILDVGCGGGILSEPLARLGARVTGLDPGIQNIQAAIAHASRDSDIKEKLDYVCDTVENLATSGSKYHAVVASEVIEHVNNIQSFVHSCVELTEDNGSLFFTTINRTFLSYFLSIFVGEYILGLIPQGTHEWNKFVKPEELIQHLESLNCRIVSLEGVMFNPITEKFSWCQNNANWYALHAVKD